MHRAMGLILGTLFSSAQALPSERTSRSYLESDIWNDGKAEIAFYQVQRDTNQYGQPAPQSFLMGTYLVKHDFDRTRGSKARRDSLDKEPAFKWGGFLRVRKRQLLSIQAKLCRQRRSVELGASESVVHELRLVLESIPGALVSPGRYRGLLDAKRRLRQCRGALRRARGIVSRRARAAPRPSARFLLLRTSIRSLCCSRTVSTSP